MCKIITPKITKLRLRDGQETATFSQKRARSILQCSKYGMNEMNAFYSHILLKHYRPQDPYCRYDHVLMTSFPAGV